MTFDHNYLHETKYVEEEWNVVVVDDMKADKKKNTPHEHQLNHK